MIRTKRNKFGRLIIWILAMSILYTGCGADGSRLLTSRKVSDRDICDHLNGTYFWDHGLTISEIKDVTEYPKETDNKVLLTCTTVATNNNVEQTANWELEFELFNDVWIGTDDQMGLNETVLIRDLTEETFAAAVCPVYSNYNYISVQRIDTDQEAKTAVAHCTMYTNGSSYYIVQDLELSLEYRDKNGYMEWVYTQAPIVKERIGDYSIIVTSEIEGHYEIEAPRSYHATFDIKQDTNNSNMFTLQNFSAQVHNSYRNQWEEFTSEDASFSFRGSDDFFDGWWSGTGRDAIIATVAMDNLNSEAERKNFEINFQIANGKFYASHGYEDAHEIKSGLSNIFPLNESYWQGGISN